MTPRLVPTVNAHDHIRGPADAPVTILEYGDFECPFSREAYPMLERLLAMSEGRVRLVFRHFPLTQVHPFSAAAAEAAEAAAGQDRFWSAHDLFYERPELLRLNDPEKVARLLGIDERVFAAALRDGRYARRVHEHFLSALRSGVTSTPTLFVNGLLWHGGYSLPELLEATGLEDLRTGAY